MFAAALIASHFVFAIAALSAPPAMDPAAATCDGIELKIATESSDEVSSLVTLVTSGGSRLARPGDVIGDTRLVAVGYNASRLSPAAWFSAPGSVCQALLFEPPARAPERDEPSRDEPSVESINDYEVSTPEKALEAYAHLRSASRLRVKLVRRGTPLTLDFHIT